MEPEQTSVSNARTCNQHQSGGQSRPLHLEISKCSRGSLRWEADWLAVIGLPGLIPTRYDSVWVHLPILSACLLTNLRACDMTLTKSDIPKFNEAVREDLTVIPSATCEVWQFLPLNSHLGFDFEWL